MMVEDHSPINKTLPGIDTYQTTQEHQEDVVMATRMTANRAKRESRKLLFQTILIIIASVALILMLVLYVIPFMIRFAGNFTGISLIQNGDTVPPVVPTYSLQYVATNSAELTIDGYAEALSTVVLVQNGQEADQSVADDAGTFSLRTQLEDGDNTIALYAKDEAENESTLGKEFTVSLDTTPPEYEWNDPADGKVITSLRERMTTVGGKTEPTAKVTLNDRFVFVNADGTFRETFQLSEGENVLKLKITDRAGNIAESERKVVFKP